MAVVSGCFGVSEPAEPLVFGSSASFEVVPSNGVWDVEYGRTGDPANCSFTFFLRRLKDGVDVVVHARDDVTVADDCEPGAVTCPSWNDDSVHVYFDGDNDRAHDSRTDDELHYGGEFALVANGAAQSDNSSHPRSFGREWTGDVAPATGQNGEKLLVYRMHFSWSCLGMSVPPRDDEDVTFGFNISLHDDDTGGRAQRALYWKGDPKRPYSDESKFGAITLKGRPAR